MHGAAIAKGERAIVLVGRAGQGKSTLAAALCADPAIALLADDAIALEPPAGDGATWTVAPTETQHWLDATAHRAFGDHEAPAYRGKWPTAAPRVAERPVPLVAIVELVFGDEPTGELALVSTNGLDALASVVPHTVRFVLDDEERHKRELLVLSDLVRRTPTLRLERRRDLARLDASVEVLRTLLDPQP